MDGIVYSNPVIVVGREAEFTQRASKLLTELPVDAEVFFAEDLVKATQIAVEQTRIVIALLRLSGESDSEQNLKAFLESLSNIPVLVVADVSMAARIPLVVHQLAHQIILSDEQGAFWDIMPSTIINAIGRSVNSDKKQILKQLVSHIPDSVCVLGPNNDILFINETFSRLYGYKENEIIGQPVISLLPERSWKIQDGFGSPGDTIETVHIHKYGHEISVAISVTSLPPNCGAENHKLCISRDITEKMSLLRKIRDSKKRLSQIFDNSSVGIVMFETNGKLVEFNERFLAFTGFNYDEMAHFFIDDLLHSDDRVKDRVEYKELLEGKIRSYTTEKRIQQKSGQFMWIRMNVSKVSDQVDQASFIIAIVEDITEKKAIEETLAATEVRLDGVLSSLEDVVYSMDAQTAEIFYVNKATKALFDMSENEFKNNKALWRKMVHGGDLSKLEIASRVLRKQGKAEVEYRLITSAGDIKWLRDRAWVVHNGNDRIDGIITDVTKRKLAEQAYLDSEERYRTAVQSSVEAIYMMNPATLRITEVNDAFCNLLGYSRQEALKLNLTDFVNHPIEDIRDYIDTVIDGGGRVLGEREWLAKSNGIINVEVTASKITQRDVEIIFVVARDVTVEKRIHDELEKERTLLQQVVANAPIPMAMLDTELRFLVNSRNWVQSYGPARRSLSGLKLFDLYPNLPEEWRALCERGLKGEILNIPEEEVHVNNDQIIYLRLAIHPWGNRDTDHYGIVLVAERIDELVNARKLAEEANMAKSAFLARITHELRTPLNAILGYSQIMIKDSSLGDNHKNYIDSMYRSGMHLLNMINDILDLSKIEASRMELQPEDTDLRELVRDLIEMFELKARSNGLALNLNFDDTIESYVRTDRAKLHQVLINLVGNAVKFTESGCVDINIKRLREEDVDEGHQFVEFEITDSGRGIPDDELSLIFEPFHQAKNSGAQGTGLGLAITKRIVNLMGGDIEVESTMGKGSTFRFIIPFEVLQSAPTVVSDEYNEVIGLLSPSEYKVLVVDDVEHNRTVVELLLQRIGFSVVQAVNGLDALEKFDQVNPDFVIMDIIMPVMDGVKAMSRIRLKENGRHVPIIALTASGFDDKRERLLEAGFTDYILKPFKEAELLRSISVYGKVTYEFGEKADKNVQIDDSTDLGLIFDQFKSLPSTVQVHLNELIELQDLDGIVQCIQTEHLSASVPAFAQGLLRAANEFDFYFITRLAKLIAGLNETT
jgi:PAS domain S-box-containing protein